MNSGNRLSNPVYIVDDDSGIRRSMVFSLGAAGYDPRPFASGEDFLAEIAWLRPGVVLLDVRMPGLDGLEVTRRLVDHRHRLPVVVMTGHGDVSTAVASLKLGAVDFIEKPFEECLLLEILEGLFDRLDGQVRDALEIARTKQQLSSLSPREMEVMRGLVEGLANKSMARRMDLSVRTVEMHRAKMLDRLNVSTTAEALRIAILAGLRPNSEGSPAD